MKTENKVVASAGVAGVVYVEEGLVWLLDRLLDVVLAYKDTIIQLLT